MTNDPGNAPTLPLLNNRYQVIQVLGDGGFGKTFLAEDTQMPSSRKCVVKQLKPVNDNPQIHQLVQERFQREAAILEELSEGTDQIPKLYAYFTEAGQFYLVEEWIEGDTLTQKLQKEGLLSQNSVREILIQILPLLAYIHQKQIVHRDIKPDNIILRQRDAKPILIDFGAVKETMGAEINSRGKSTRSIVVGTPGFMPSEQLAGRPLYASDLYSLGLTAIYLLSGKLPQELDTDLLTGKILWRSQAPQVSDDFAAVLDKAVQLQPSDRFATAQEMLKALESLGTATALPAATVVSSIPPSLSGVNTIAIASPPAHSLPTQITPSQLSPTTGEWKKAVIIGGLIGASILASTWVIRAQLLGVLENVAKAPKPDSSPTSQTTPTPTPSQTPSQPSPSFSPPAVEPPLQSFQAPPPAPAPQININPTRTNATIVGEPGYKNIRSGPGTNYRKKHIAYPGDRVQVIGATRNSDNFPWYKIYFPLSGAEGWIAGHLLAIDGQAPYQPRSSAPSRQLSRTNATIVGEPGKKNIRTGPGTNYRARHIAYPGDRVQIVGSDYDGGGYLWYKVYFPKSGADGWIAAQLIKVD
jgi:serine/threonine-protein kinase